jgi:hypothetical protein
MIEEPALAEKRYLLLFQICVIFYYLITQQKLVSVVSCCDAACNKRLSKFNLPMLKVKQIDELKEALIDMHEKQLEELLKQIRAYSKDA